MEVECVTLPNANADFFFIFLLVCWFRGMYYTPGDFNQTNQSSHNQTDGQKEPHGRALGQQQLGSLGFREPEGAVRSPLFLSLR